MAKKKKKSKQFNLIKAIKKNARENQLKMERLVGKARAKSFGGKPPVEADRRDSKRSLRRLDNGEDSR